MATREKKARSVTADSPTPSLGSANSGSNSNISAIAAATPSTNSATGAGATGAGGSDSAPTTPTSTRKGTVVGNGAGSGAVASGNVSGSGGSSTSSSTRGSLSRLKSKQLLLPNTADDPEETAGVSDTIVTTPSRTTRGAASDGSVTPAFGKEKDDGAQAVNASKDLTKSPAVGARRTTTSKTAALEAASEEQSRVARRSADNRKGRVVALKRTSLLKRKGKKIIGKPILGRKVLARRQLVAVTKASGTRGAGPMKKKDAATPAAPIAKEDELLNTPSLRNGKPRNSDSPVAKRKSAVLKSDTSKSPDGLVYSIKLERRRSCSVSKYLDATDDAETGGFEVKRDLLDHESRNKMLYKMAEAFNELKSCVSPVPTGTKDDKGQSSSGGTLRRSMRQRKSTARDKEDFLTPRGKSASGGGAVEIKVEPTDSLEGMESSSVDGDGENATSAVAVPLMIDTTEADVPIGAEPLHSDGATSGGEPSGGGGPAAGAGEEELPVGKDPSLSPGELISEGVSEQSVKECYGEPAFLENNLGIEKDPKLGEIVQERFRCDKVSDESEGASAERADEARNAAGDGGGALEDDVHVVIVEEEEESASVESGGEVTHEEEKEVPTVAAVGSGVASSDGKEERDVEQGEVEEDMELQVTLDGEDTCAEDDQEMEAVEETKVGDCGGDDEVVEEGAVVDVPEDERMDTDLVEEPATEVSTTEAEGPQKTEETPEESLEQKKTFEEKDNPSAKTDDDSASVEIKLVVDADDVKNSSPKSSEVAGADAGVAVSPPAAEETVPSKTNGESNGTVASSEQSTPNQPTAWGLPKSTVSSPVTPKSSKPSAAGGMSTGKETKAKTRITKEKSKEDEKTREEKLRQEKLRVEEKVREEKQRAERLEAEFRLKLERLQQRQQEQKEAEGKVLENGDSEDGSASASSEQNPDATPAAEKEHKTEQAKVIALGGLTAPTITIAFTKKEGSPVADAVDVKPKTKLDIVPINAADSGQLPAVVLLSKEEKPAMEGGSENASPAPTLADSVASRSESAAAERRDGKSPALTVRKADGSNGSGNEADVAEDSNPPSAVLDESDDAAKRKESHLKHLGLLTIQAASEEKQRQREQKPSSSAVGFERDPQEMPASGGGANRTGGTGWLSVASGQSGSGSGRSASSGSGNKSTRSSKDEYTVSMKTVLKGGSGTGARGEKRKQQRMPLKMTFQKGKGKDTSNGSSGASSNGSGYATDSGNNGDTTYYTVHSNELDHHSSNSSDGHSHRESGASGGRKAHSRSHTTDGVGLAEAVGDSTSTKEVIQKSLVIPEKASSFNVHPERLCRDQCSYCGGKFGLYDTPCHVAAIKSTERQQRILLATLPKITLDSCLCDACYRHVDRKANCPPQKKKSTTVSQTSSTAGPSATTNTSTQSTVSPIVLKVTTNKDGSASIATDQPVTVDDGHTAGGKAREICAVRQCTAHAMQSLRRKWVLKMKRKISKQLDINLDQAAKATAEFISICNKHYEQISHLMICAMCTKPLQRNHVYHMYNNIPQLERLIQEQGISMRLSSSELVVCKLCKYYANLLLKPPDAKSKKAQFVKDYNRRLCNLRQRVSEEQDEQDVLVQNVEATIIVPSTSRQQRHSMPVDIVISDGEDDGEEEADEDDVEECTEQQDQAYQMLGELFSIGDSSVSLRRRVSHRKSPDVTIVENNGAPQMSELGEITIIPTSKSLSAANHQQQQQRDDNIDMTRVLKSNPNISMRELFPGEEELGVHVNIPFSTSSVRTPEGWTKVTSTIQYDDNTRALWEELQKPYGNQSSFLRHLILLEKYFRNGDLVLSPQAKNNATTYSEAVQNRLRSYDNVPSANLSSPPALTSLTVAAAPTTSAVDKTSSIFQQFSSATITIVPATKARPKAASSVGNVPESTPITPPAPVSLLKSNNLHLTYSSNEPTTKSSLKRKLSNEGKQSLGTTGVTSPPASSGAGVSKLAKVDEPKVPSSAPPELISINRKQSVTITTIPTAALMPATSAPPKQQSLLQSSPQQSLLQSVPVQAKKSPAVSETPSGTTVVMGNTTREVIQMPEQLTEAERRESSRPWRPTLLPIAAGVVESLKTGPVYRTADGRLLPMLVQVMSGGKPYHISIQDYNRMCILRREKLLQQQQNMIQTANKRQTQLPQPKQQTSQPTTTVTATVIPPVLRVVNSPPETQLVNSVPTSVAAPTKMVQLPNQLLEQNSLIPIIGGVGKASVHPTAPKNASSLMVTMTTTMNNNSLAKTTNIGTVQTTLKPLSLPNSTTVFPMMISANTITLPSAMSTMVAQSSSSSSSSSSAGSKQPSSGLVIGGTATNCNVVTVNPLDQLLKGGNLVTQAQLQQFAAANAVSNGASEMDSSPAQLLSKIPKSLTVIPQQKQRSMSRVSSNEDQNSA